MFRILKPIIKWWVRKHYGEECETFMADCPTCNAWLGYYYLFEYDNEEIVGWDNKRRRWHLKKKEVYWS